MKTHGRTANAHYQVKEADWKRIPTVGYPGKARLLETIRDQWPQGDANGREPGGPQRVWKATETVLRDTVMAETPPGFCQNQLHDPKSEPYCEPQTSVG